MLSPSPSILLTLMSEGWMACAYVYVFWVSVLTLGYSLTHTHRVIMKTDWGVTCWLFFLWGLAQISMAFVLTTFLNKVRTATVLGYGITILSTFAANILNSQIIQLDRAPILYYV